MSTPKCTTLVLGALALALAACGDSQTSAAQETTQAAGGPAAAQKTSRVAGQAAMGPLRQAWVNAFTLEADGSFGANLGAVTTQADGSFALDVLIPANAAVAFTVQGGTYTDEASEVEVQVDVAAGAEGNAQAAADANVLQCWVADVSQTSQVAVTALTTMAAGFARQAISSGQTDIGAAIGHGKTQVQTFFSDPNGDTLLDFDFTTTLPLDLTVEASGSVDAHRASYGSILSGISQLVHQSNQSAAAGLNVLGQLIAITRQDSALFAQAIAQARAGAQAEASLDGNLLVGDSLHALAQLGAQIVKALPVAIHAFLDGPRAKTQPPSRPPLAAPPAPVAHEIVGRAWLAGPLAGAQIVAWAVDGNGQTHDSPQLGSTQSDAAGHFHLAIPTAGWVRLVTMGGHYADPVFDANDVSLATGGSLSVDVKLDAEPGAGPVHVNITPVTHFVSARLAALLAVGGTQADAAMAAAQHDVRIALGLPGGVDLTTVEAVDIHGPVAGEQLIGAKVSLVTAGLAFVLNGHGLAATSLIAAVEAIARDLGDGLLNGRGAVQDTVVLGVQALTYKALMQGLNEAIAAILASAGNLGEVKAQLALQATVNIP